MKNGLEDYYVIKNNKNSGTATPTGLRARLLQRRRRGCSLTGEKSGKHRSYDPRRGFCSIWRFWISIRGRRSPYT